MEEGIPVELSSRATSVDPGLEQEIVVRDTSFPLVQGSSEPIEASASLQDDIILENLAKEVLSLGKGLGSASYLGVLQCPLKKGHFQHSSKVSHKKDLDKIKTTRDLMVESGSVKTIDAHFAQPSS